MERIDTTSAGAEAPPQPLELSRADRRRQQREAKRMSRALHRAHVENVPDWQRAGVFVTMMQDGVPEDATLGWLAERFAFVAGIGFERALKACARANEEAAKGAAENPEPITGPTTH